MKDVSLFLLVFTHWLVVSLVVDAVTEDVAAKKVASVWIFAVSALVNLFSITRSWMLLGTGKGPPETIVGLFIEVVNLSHVWGSFFAVARLFSHDGAGILFDQTLLEVEFECLIEMGLVSGGVGFTTLLPTTTFERIVTWLAAYVGGLLVTNMFLLSVVLSRRGYWERVPQVETINSGANLAATSGKAVELTFTLPQSHRRC